MREDNSEKKISQQNKLQKKKENIVVNSFHFFIKRAA